MHEELEEKTQKELIGMIRELMMECDMKQSHVNALREQLRENGIAPREHGEIDAPWTPQQMAEDMEGHMFG